MGKEDNFNIENQIDEVMQDETKIFRKQVKINKIKQGRIFM